MAAMRKRLPDLVLGKKPDRRHQNPGRGQYEADINWTSPTTQTYYNQFAQACHDLTYHDMNALHRALNLSMKTMYRWRDGKSFPRLIDTVVAVLNWHNAGKPIIVRSQREIAASMRPRHEQS